MDNPKAVAASIKDEKKRYAWQILRRLSRIINSKGTYILQRVNKNRRVGIIKGASNELKRAACYHDAALVLEKEMENLENG